MEVVLKRMEQIKKLVKDDRLKTRINRILNELKELDIALQEKVDEIKTKELIEVVEGFFGNKICVNNDEGCIYVENWEVLKKGLRRILKGEQLNVHMLNTMMIGVVMLCLKFVIEEPRQYGIL